MTARKKTISVAALSVAIGLVTGLVASTARAIAWSDERAHVAAVAVVAPVEKELHDHEAAVEKALQPGGAFHEFQVRSEERDAFLVDAVTALCRANPRAVCPSPARLVSSSR
jgi:hypothetical protein